MKTFKVEGSASTTLPGVPEPVYTFTAGTLGHTSLWNQRDDGDDGFISGMGVEFTDAVPLARDLERFSG